ncbi:MAG: dehypoxanthine futalosine cyclase [Clostridia bacterium]|nr:dehypoxanthine futalosine cyclase [Clostridia bacterium]
MTVSEILTKVIAKERLSAAEGLTLLQQGDLLALGIAANEVKKRIHSDDIVTFVIDRNINYTNICEVKCRFCAFYREQGHSDAYVLSKEEIFHKIQETVEVGGTQILMQGGIHPGLGLDYYLDLLASIKKRFHIHIHSFSPPEIWHMAQMSKLTVKEIILKLKEAGLDSLPGGGAEILTDQVRHHISPKKISWRQWLEVMETAHGVGLRTTATMMFGSVETLEDRILHLVRLRELQDKTGGFTAFIPWSYQPGNTDLGGSSATGIEYLKMLAVSRIMLDNFTNIQASWVTQGAKMAQVSLWFGANDFGGTMLEENVVRATGVSNTVPLDEIINAIKNTGNISAQRNTMYTIIKRYD